MNYSERRRAERFKGAIPIELKDGRGLSRDFSTDGIFFETDQPLSVGEQLDFIMQLNHADPAYPLRLSCRGVVLRVEQGLEKRGVAVSITSHLFAGTRGLAQSYFGNAMRLGGNHEEQS